MRDIAMQLLVFFGVAVCALSSLGILVMRGMYDKLHYLAPMSTVGAAAIVAAVLLNQSPSWSALKPVLLVLLLALSSAVLTQATARAKEFRERRKKTEQEGK